jgi:hypothetical protein
MVIFSTLQKKRTDLYALICQYSVMMGRLFCHIAALAPLSHSPTCPGLFGGLGGFAFLVGNGAGGFAGGLAGSLALTAAAGLDGGFEILFGYGFDVLQVFTSRRFCVLILCYYRLNLCINLVCFVLKMLKIRGENFCRQFYYYMV